MSSNQFIEAVDKLVWKWMGSDSLTPRAELEKIYFDIREQVVHDVAVSIGPTLHKHYTNNHD